MKKFIFVIFISLSFCSLSYTAQKKHKNVFVPILMYHKVEPSILKSKLKVRPNDFESQIKYLSENNFKSITLGELCWYLRGKKEIPPKSIVITFDDGYENTYTYAYPVLKKYNFKATIFLIAGKVGENIRWERERMRPTSKLLNWQQIKEMSDYGIEFGSHTITHPDLTKLSTKLASYEIRKSKEIIERELNKEVYCFAYPYGKNNKRIRKLVKYAGYKCAVSTRQGTLHSRDNVFALKRIRVYGAMKKEEFTRIVNTPY